MRFWSTVGADVLPACHRCGRRVERVELWDRDDGGIAYIAYCHHARERVDLSLVERDGMCGPVRFTAAFITEPDLRDSMFRLMRAPPPGGPALLRLAGDDLDEHAYAAYGVRRYEPPEGS